MSEILHATLRLYLDALRRAGRSFVQCWMIAIVVVVFAGLM